MVLHVPRHQLNVCAELNGKKVNIELMFTARPSVREFIDAAEAFMNSELAIRSDLREGPAHHFKVHRISIFDKGLAMWLDLTTGSQLESFSQTYAFQWQGGPFLRCESVQDLPCPMPPTYHAAMPVRPVVVEGR
ncbi:calmodulin-like protein containing EF hand domain [Diplonema papillatum]|nr:calmodulin-like protein containing EF hand domain [Diplonema papillatum]